MPTFCRCPACIDAIYWYYIDYVEIVRIIDADIDKILAERGEI
jgi:hypothetical protein